MRSGFGAQGPLALLSREFDVFGPLRGPLDPWLVAELDQHTASVRDSIAGGGSDLSPRSLDGYLRGFVAGCRERGWHSDTADYDWETVRLLAICRLAKECGFVR
ncbi:DUF6401 family natural product biosynthesis protein [Nocardiopsis coralliicola]